MKFRCLWTALRAAALPPLLALLLLPALPRPALAATTFYNIQFSGVGTLPAYGTFFYDATNAVFGGFTVSWNGQQWDLSSAANAPTVGSACAGTPSSAATTFALLNHSLCGGLYYRWFGNSSASSGDFTFNASTLALPEQLGARITVNGAGSGSFITDFGGGDWTIAALPGHLTHIINFTGVGTLPSVGYASYDAAASHFDMLMVSWEGRWYDLTGQANAPTTGLACAGTTSSAATTFAMLSHSLCDGLYYRWFGNGNFNTSDFTFNASTLALPEQLGARMTATGPGTGSFITDFGGGDWTFTALPVPEPASAALMLLGGLLLAARRVWMKRATAPIGAGA